MISLSEITFYEFLKDRIKLSDTDARQYTKELFLSEEIRQNKEKVIKEKSNSNLPDDSFDHLLISMEKGSRQVIIFLIWMIFWFMVIFVLAVKY